LLKFENFIVTNAMTGYVAKKNTLVKLEDDSGYGNYTDIVSDDNLAFQYYSFYQNKTNYERMTNWTGPLLMKAGPNVTLWNILQNGTSSPNFQMPNYSQFL
jgi:hypothetical protein